MLIVEEVIGGFVSVYAPDGEGLGVVEQWSTSSLEAATRALEAAALRITVKPGQCQPMEQIS